MGCGMWDFKNSSEGSSKNFPSFSLPTSCLSLLYMLAEFYFIIQFSRCNPLQITISEKMVEIMRFELMTPCLQGRCSPN